MNYRLLYDLINGNEEFAMEAGLIDNHPIPLFESPVLALTGQDIDQNGLPIDPDGYWSMTPEGILKLNFLDYRSIDHECNLTALYHSVNQLEKTLRIELSSSNVIIKIYSSHLSICRHQKVLMNGPLRSFLDILSDTDIIELGCRGMLRKPDALEIFPYLRWRKYGVRPDNTIDLSF